MTKHVSCWVTLAVLLVSSAFASGTGTHRNGTGSPLDAYVLKDDTHYKWSDTGKRITGLIPWEKWEGAILEMTSQAWLSPAEVDCSVWTHRLVVITPAHYDHKKTALLVIVGGHNDGERLTAVDPNLIVAATVAVKTKSLVAVLYQVPNQPCIFAEEKPRRARSEDDLIAYTWYHFLEHPDQPEYLLRLPMIKAAVRAMDTVEYYMGEEFGIQVENFVVTGASKRGWATWLTAAVDSRIVGIIPILMDSLNFQPNIHHFYKSLGGWPFAYKPYYDLNLTERIDTPEFRALMNIVDPHIYRDRYTMPKLVISASNDEFFLIDDSYYFWDDLPGEKHLLILSNAEHTLITGLPKLLVAIESFFLSIVEGHELTSSNGVTDFARKDLIRMPVGNKLADRRPGFGGRPKYWWNVNRAAGMIEIGVSEKPIQVLLWYANTKKLRDFRWFRADDGHCEFFAIKGYCIQPVFFHHRTQHPSGLDGGSGNRYYFAKIPFPEEGYGAFFVEMRFSGPKVLSPFVFTTGAVIIPDMFPFEDCHGLECKGHLV